MEPEEQIFAINLPPPVQRERAAYRRAISRTYAEWPLVEAVIRVVHDGDKISLARVAGGGIAPVPLRLLAVEESLAGKQLDEATVAAAAKRATNGAKPLPLTGYKIVLLEGLVASMLSGLRG
jgi:xanthine dehydrogenase YagS FAD-binding subunit